MNYEWLAQSERWRGFSIIFLHHIIIVFFRLSVWEYYSRVPDVHSVWIILNLLRGKRITPDINVWRLGNLIQNVFFFFFLPTAAVGPLN